MSQPVPILDTMLRGKRLHVDSQAITFGGKSFALEEVEWVSYWAANVATKRFMSPTSHHSEWTFAVGRYPYQAAPSFTVHDYLPGRHDELPENWAFLVNLAKEYLEPRLVADLTDRVRGGATVTVGGSVKVNLDVIACRKPKVSVPWPTLRRCQLWEGTVWVYQDGVEKPVLTVPQSHPNAALMPTLFATLRS